MATQKIRKQRIKSRNTHKPVIKKADWNRILKLPWKERELYCLSEMRDEAASELGPVFTKDMVIICDYGNIESGVNRINILLRLFQLNCRLTHVHKDSKPGRPVFKMMYIETQLIYI